MDKSHRVALITGAAGTLGTAASERLAHDGFRVVLSDCSGHIQAQAEALRQRGMQADAIEADLADAGAIQALVEAVLSRHARCDVLLNNAGIHPLGAQAGAADLENTALADWQRALAINLTAPFLLSQAVFPQMKRQGGGRIINVASRAARTPIPGTAVHYSATKAGLVGLTRTLAEKGAAFNITCNAIAPGRFPSPLADSMPADEIAASIKRIPLGRVGQPAEFAGVVAFLSSEAASYMTGAVLDVNGGAFIG